MEHLPTQRLDNPMPAKGVVFPPIFAVPVDRVACHREAHMGKVDPYLMGPARFDGEAQEGQSKVEHLYLFPSGSGRSAPLKQDRHLFPSLWMTSYGQIDGSGLGIHGAMDDCKIFLPHLPRLELLRKQEMRAVILGHDQNP